MTTNPAPADDITLPDFGDYVLIEQHRYGVPNERHPRSNPWQLMH